MSIGPGAFLVDQFAFRKHIDGSLPDSAIVKPIRRKTLQLVSKTVQPTDQDLSFEFDQFNGALEYAVSGWIKWSGDQKTGSQHNVIIVAQKKLNEISGIDKIGE